MYKNLYSNMKFNKQINIKIVLKFFNLKNNKIFKNLTIKNMKDNKLLKTNKIKIIFMMNKKINSAKYKNTLKLIN